MTTSIPPLPPVEDPLQGTATADAARRVFRVALALTVLGLVGNAFSAILGVRSQIWQNRPELIAVGVWYAYTLVCLLSLWLSRRGRPRLAAWLLLGGLLVNIPLSSLLIARLGFVTGVGLIGVSAIVATAMGRPPAEIRRAVLAGVGSGVLTFLLDGLGAANRPVPPAPVLTLISLVIGATIAVCAYFLLRDFQTFSLRYKLILAFLAVALIPLSLLVLLNNRLTHASLLDAANRSLSAAAAETANRLDDFINYNLDMVGTAAQFPALGEYLLLPPEERAEGRLQSDIIQYLSSLNAERRASGSTTYLHSYTLVDRNGQVVLDTAAPPRNIGQDVSGRDYFRRPFQAGAPFASPVEFEPGVGALLYFSAQIIGPNQQPVGVLAVRYDATLLQQLIAQSSGLVGERSSAILVDENHVRLGDGEGPELIFRSVTPLSLDRIAELQAAWRLPVRPIEELSTNLPDLKRALVQARTQPYPAGAFHPDPDLEQGAIAALTTQPWWIVYEQTNAELLAPIEAQTRVAILLALFIAVVVMGAAVGVARWLSNPLARLTAVASQIASGNFTVRARVDGDDEIGALASAFNTMTTRLQETLLNLEQRVAERTSELQAAADIGRAITSVRNLDELLRLALQLIRERFGFYHASIFLMDQTNTFAILRESTGEIGAQLKASGHKLAVGSKSLIGWVTANRYPRVALDTEADPFHFKNPLLPNTRSELAIPLLVGPDRRLLGVLDVQSTTPNAFEASDVQVLQTLADLFSIAIENAELFQRTETSLVEAQRRYQQVAGTSLRTLLQSRSREIVYELRPLPLVVTHDSASSAVEAPVEDPLQGAETPPGRRPLEVPLRLRGEVVGTLELHGRSPDELSLEEQTVLDAAAAQLAVALESAALFEETQRRSHREQLINQISDQMRASLNPTTIVQSGIRELGKALGATQVVVQLHVPVGATPADAQPQVEDPLQGKEQRS